MKKMTMSIGIEASPESALNFCVFGVLVVAFAIGLGHQLPGSRAIATSLGLFGALFFLLGFFPDRPIPWPDAAILRLAIAINFCGKRVLVKVF